MSKITRRDIFLLAYQEAPNLADSVIHKGEEEIGWKVCINSYFEPVLVKLLISKDANRTWYKNKKYEKYSKHRCSQAKVLGFYSYYTGKEVTEQYKKGNCYAYSLRDNSFRYIPGEWVKPRWAYMENSLYYSFSPKVCDSGIHYFKTKESAYMWADLHVTNHVVFISCRPRHNAYRMMIH